LAFRLLPHDRRRALCAVYAFCRAADDIADDGAPRDAATLLARWREELDAVYAGRPRHPIGVALADTVERFAIPREHFAAVIEGVEMDLHRERYETWEGDLEAYCYRVASAVGLVCIEIFGYTDPSARQYAIELGLAFQLTNILRDVAEDARRGRIYLPRADLRRFGCREEDVLVGHCTEAFRQVMAFECARAGEHYGRARFLLAEEDRQSLAPAEAMRLIYEQLLRRIMFRHYDVFGPKIRLTRPEKAGPAVAAWVRPHLRVLYWLSG
jgi:phytoene synthase